MKRRLARMLIVLVFLGNGLAVTWPVLSLFSAAKPFVFGFPQSMAWPVGWILVSGIALLVLDRIETQHEGE
ncbi:MAG: hypothetical protein AAGI24_03965 [Pseudomonadota bacterium]